MKTKIYLLVAIALVFSACTTGSFVSTGYVDGIYFNPADVPPPVMAEEVDVREEPVTVKSGERVIISEISDNEEGDKTMTNYVFDGEDAGEYVDAQMYNLDQMELEQSDTTIYYDDNEVRYVINNYYDGSDIDFSYRINRFHRPYSRFYDPFYWNDWYWDPWGYDYYSPYSSFGWSYGWGYDPWGWGYSPWYGGYYGGYNGGYYGNYYGGWYSPYSPYYSYYGWGYPYHNNYWGGHFNSDNYQYGRRRDFATSADYGRGTRATQALGERGGVKSANTRSGSLTSDGERRVRTITPDGTSTRGIREGSAAQSRTLTEMRRGTTGTPQRTVTGQTPVTRGTSTGNLRSTTPAGTPQQGVRSTTGTTTRQYTRPATGATDTYTPSYNQERSTGRSTYNVREYSRPSTATGSQGTVKSTGRPVTTYSRPSSSTSSDRTYRSTSTYNRSSSSGTRYSAPSQSRSTYSAPSRSSSSGSYSSPSRSSSYSSGSSGSYSSGSSGSSSSGSSSSGRSGGGSSSSGGGSGRR